MDSKGKRNQFKSSEIAEQDLCTQDILTMIKNVKIIYFEHSLQTALEKQIQLPLSTKTQLYSTTLIFLSFVIKLPQV